MFSIGVWDTKVARTGKAARAASFNRVMLFLLNVVFVFSIGVWDTKVARTGKAARAASFNRVMLFLLNVVFCALYWCLGHESGQNKQGCESG